MTDGAYILDPAELHLPPRPAVETVKVAEITDSIGDPAFWVWVVLKEPVSKEERSWKQIRPIEEEIRKTLRHRYGTSRFPYFNFVTPSELAEETVG